MRAQTLATRNAPIGTGSPTNIGDSSAPHQPVFAHCSAVGESEVAIVNQLMTQSSPIRGQRIFHNRPLEEPPTIRELGDFLPPSGVYGGLRGRLRALSVPIRFSESQDLRQRVRSPAGSGLLAATARQEVLHHRDPGAEASMLVDGAGGRRFPVSHQGPTGPQRRRVPRRGEQRQHRRVPRAGFQRIAARDLHRAERRSSGTCTQRSCPPAAVSGRKSSITQTSVVGS